MLSSYAEAQYFYGDLGDLPFTHCGSDGTSVEFRPPSSLPTIESGSITLPWGGMHNYGHFVLDCLTSVVSLSDIGQPRYPYLFPILAQWQRQHLARLSVQSAQELSGDVWFCGDVLWTSNMDHCLQAPNQSFRRLQETYPIPEARPGRRNLWLSRGHDKKRCYPAAAELEANLVLAGFDVIQPETLSVTEQLAAAAGASLIAGFTGAAFANAVFCQPGTVIVEIQPSLMPGTWIRNLADTVGCEWIPFFCDSEPASPPVVVGGLARPDIGIKIDLEPKALLAFLKGLIAASGVSDKSLNV